MSTDVFISYSTHDTEAAQAICSALEAASLSCWMAPRNITPGQTWSEAIIDGINGAQVMVLLYTSASNASPQVLREVERAVSKRLGLIAFRAENVTLSKPMEYLVSVSHWLEGHIGSREEHLDSLVQSVRFLLTTRTVEESSLSSALPSVPAPAPAPLALPPHNLPEQLTSFIGREKQRAEVKGLLQTHRLLTLTGTGGTGKTRLSLQIGTDLLPAYRDGVWLAELASVTDPSLVAQSVATALNIREEPGRPLLDTLTEAFQSKTLLLLLDNCEHVLKSAALLADRLIKLCPRVRVLATSRERLGISGEQTYPIPPLSVPEPRQSLELETLQQVESVRLFIDRALLSKPDFALTPQAVPALASVCHRLDGIPLAIELAAARVRALSVEEINTRLDNQFRLLTGGSRTALPRQQTLKALMDWSYDLLNEQEKRLLHRLSVFAGGWTLEAAEKVCSGEGMEEWEVLDLLLSLSDKSLVVYDERHGEARYRLLETIRQYAADRLQERGEAESFQRRHYDFFLSLAEQANRGTKGPEVARWLNRLEDEHDNLRAALEGFARDSDRGEEGLRLATALNEFWEMRGFLEEAREHLRTALAHENAQEPTIIRAEAMRAFGNVLSDMGNYDDAIAEFEASLAIQRTYNNRRGIAALLGNLASLARNRGDCASARPMFEEVLEISREIKDALWECSTLINLGITVGQEGKHEEARALFKEARLHCETMGNRRLLLYTVSNLAVIANIDGNAAEAGAFYAEVFSLCQELGDKTNMAYAMEGLGGMCRVRERFQPAARLFGAAQALRESIGVPPRPANLEGIEIDLAALRTALGDNAFEEAFRSGSVLSWEQAITFAIEEAQIYASARGSEDSPPLAAP